jgi:hypothetical protein
MKMESGRKIIVGNRMLDEITPAHRDAIEAWSVRVKPSFDLLTTLTHSNLLGLNPATCMQEDDRVEKFVHRCTE